MQATRFCLEHKFVVFMFILDIRSWVLLQYLED